MRTLFRALGLAALLALTGCAPTRPAPEQPAAPRSPPGVPAVPSAVPPPGSASRLELPGKRPDGSVLLPNHWSLRPAGKQVELGISPST